MSIFHTSVLTVAIASLAVVSGCSQPPAEHEAQAETADSATFIGKAVDQGIAKARKELHAGNISIGGDGIDVDINGKHYTGDENDGRPRAEITPQGELLVDGKAVDASPAQRAMLLEYRGQVIGVAEAGMEIGSKAADLAGRAVKESLGALFSGNTDVVEKRVEAEAMKLKSSAKALCTQLPPMRATQQKLAASLPAFKPYANLSQQDIDDCLKDIDEEGVWSTQ